MLCPCCGEQMRLGDADCSCGARIVGEPLPESPFKVQRLGPAMTAVALTITSAAACRITLWMALGAIPATWFAWRAFRLAKRDPEGYGGRRVSAYTLAILLVAGSSLGIFEISRIPRYIEKRNIVPTMSTQAAILHSAGFLEEYKRLNGSYPNDSETLNKAAGEAPPLDYWQRPIKYVSYGEFAAMYSSFPTDTPGHIDVGAPIHDVPSVEDAPGIEFHNFELRSAGPDGIFGTADDIVMRDGVFCTNPGVLKRPLDRPLEKASPRR